MARSAVFLFPLGESDWRKKKMSERLLTCREVATFLGLSPNTIRNLTCQRRIPFVRVGSRTVRFRESDLRSILTNVPALSALAGEGE